MVQIQIKCRWSRRAASLCGNRPNCRILAIHHTKWRNENTRRTHPVLVLSDIQGSEMISQGVRVCSNSYLHVVLVLCPSLMKEGSRYLKWRDEVETKTSPRRKVHHERQANPTGCSTSLPVNLRGILNHDLSQRGTSVHTIACNTLPVFYNPEFI